MKHWENRGLNVDHLQPEGLSVSVILNKAEPTASVLRNAASLPAAQRKNCPVPSIGHLLPMTLISLLFLRFFHVFM